MEQLNHPLTGHTPHLPPQEGLETTGSSSPVPPDQLTMTGQITPSGPPPTPSYINEATVAMITLASTSSNIDQKSNKKAPPPELASLAVIATSATLKGSNNMALIGTLCNQGFSLNTPDPVSGNTALSYVAMNAKTEKDWELLKELKGHGASIDAPDASGLSPWVRAACSGNTTTMKALEAYGANLKSVDARAMKSVLQDALVPGGKGLRVVSVFVEELSQRGINPTKLLVELGLEGKIASSCVNCLDAVLNGYWEEGDENWTSLADDLRLALKQEPEKPIEPLSPENTTALKADRSQLHEVVTQKNSEGQTVLHLAAAQGGDGRLIDFLIAAGGDIHAVDHRGNTPLHTASEHNNPQIAEALLQQNAKLEERNNMGHTPLDVAQVRKHPEVTTLFVQAGAKNRDLPALRDTYTERISLSPPLPQQGINDLRSEANKSRFTSFVPLHHSEVRDAVAAMIDCTDYVSFNDFEQQFNTVIDHLNHTIPQGEEYIVLVEPQKSNKWLAELAFAKLNTPPKNVVRIDDLEQTLLLPENKSVKRVVLLDDASYSGEQMCRFVRESAVASFTAAKTSDFTIHVAIPFLTEWASQKITAINQDANVGGNGRVELSPHRKMKSAADQVPVEHHEMLSKTYFAADFLKNVFILVDSFAELAPETLANLADIFKQFNVAEASQFLPLIQKIIARSQIVAQNSTGSDFGDIFKVVEDPDILKDSAIVVKALVAFWAREQTQITRLISNFDNGIPVEGMSPDDVENLRDVVGLMEKVLENEKKFDYSSGLESRTLTVFDHKVADELSTCPAYEHGEVYDLGEPQGGQSYPLFPGKPPYKQIYD